MYDSNLLTMHVGSCNIGDAYRNRKDRVSLVFDSLLHQNEAAQLQARLLHQNYRRDGEDSVRAQVRHGAESQRFPRGRVHFGHESQLPQESLHP